MKTLLEQFSSEEVDRTPEGLDDLMIIITSSIQV